MVHVHEALAILRGGIGNHTSTQCQARHWEPLTQFSCRLRAGALGSTIEESGNDT